MKKLFGKKIVSILLAFSFFAAASLWAQAAEEDLEDFDDFDSIFESAAEDIEVEQTEPVIPVASSSSGIVFTGHFSGDIGLSAIIIEKPDLGGYIALDNTLYMSVRPAPVVSINGAVNTSLSNKFSIGLSYFYFDYMLFDRIFISAGKKSVSWGYTRLFSNGNIMADTNGQLNAEIRFPWSTGTLTFVGAYNYAVLSSSPSYKDITYALSIEQTLFHTSLNLFAKKYGQSESSDGIHKHPLAGLELKRTFFGYDVYTQAYTSLANYKKLDSKEGYERVTATAGFYKLWDGFDPNLGINIEYQYNWTPGAASGSNAHNHKIMLQGGIKRIGKNKNMKGGVDWNHNFSTDDGSVTAAFIIDGILPYASWKNALSVDYGPATGKTKFTIGSVISLSLDY